MSDLKPCPFCGSTDVHTSPNGENYAYVYCITCGAEGPTNNIGSVVMTWNRRAQSSTPNPVEVGTTVQAVPLLSDAELLAMLVALDNDTKRLPSGFRNFARSVEAAVRAKCGIVGKEGA